MASQSFKRSAQLAVAGALAVGAFAATAAPASADPITIPGVGTFEVPGVSIPQLPVIPGITDIAPAAPAAPISSVGEQAVRAAESKLGSPYVYGAAGPGSYDCSGLTMAAWASAGVSLPHSAADQYNYGRHVSFGQLEPGDLLFYYSPIGHVTIYIGDGLMVSAPQDGEDVSVVPAVQGNGYVGSTRLTG